MRHQANRDMQRCRGEGGRAATIGPCGRSILYYCPAHLFRHMGFHILALPQWAGKQEVIRIRKMPQAWNKVTSQRLHFVHNIWTNAYFSFICFILHSKFERFIFTSLASLFLYDQSFACICGLFVCFFFALYSLVLVGIFCHTGHGDGGGSIFVLPITQYMVFMCFNWFINDLLDCFCKNHGK